MSPAARSNFTFGNELYTSDYIVWSTCNEISKQKPVDDEFCSLSQKTSLCYNYRTRPSAKILIPRLVKNKLKKKEKKSWKFFAECWNGVFSVVVHRIIEFLSNPYSNRRLIVIRDAFDRFLTDIIMGKYWIALEMQNGRNLRSARTMLPINLNFLHVCNFRPKRHGRNTAEFCEFLSIYLYLHFNSAHYIVHHVHCMQQFRFK